MAESDPVLRLKAAARRASGQVTVETQHRWYMDELEQTIGRDPSASAWHREEAARPKWLGTFVLLALIAAISFAVTAAVMLWKDGTLGRFFSDRQILAEKEQPRWILGDMETGRPSAVPTGMATKSDAPPNEIEPLLQPPPQAGQQATSPEAGPSAQKQPEPATTVQQGPGVL